MIGRRAAHAALRGCEALERMNFCDLSRCRRSVAAPLLFTLVAFVAFIGGCERRAPAPAPAGTPTAQALRIDLSTPRNAVRSLIECLRAELSAVERHDRAGVEACREKLLEIVSIETIAAAVAKRQKRVINDRSAVARSLARAVSLSWGSVIAYYADGIDLEDMVCPAPAPNTRKVFALVPARGPEENVEFRIRCVLDKDESWRIAGIDFHVPATTTRPAAPPP